MIAATIGVTVQNPVSNTPVAGRYILGSTVTAPENTIDFYFPDSPF